MLSIRQQKGGFEISFTEPLDQDGEKILSGITLQQWYYQPTSGYGGPKLGLETILPENITLSEDRKKVYLNLPELKPGHVVYFLLPEMIRSESGQKLWSGEAWYTLNQQILR
ncbi:MAG: hypothetical protein R3C61_26800 [Bacteroidia bacterium]